MELRSWVLVANAVVDGDLPATLASLTAADLWEVNQIGNTLATQAAMASANREAETVRIAEFMHSQPIMETR